MTEDSSASEIEMVRREEAYVQIVNDMLDRFDIGRLISSLSECSPSMYVVLLEAMFKRRIATVNRKPSTSADHIFNAQVVLDLLQSKFNLPTRQLSATKLFEKDPLEICKMVEMMVTISTALPDGYDPGSPSVSEESQRFRGSESLDSQEYYSSSVAESVESDYQGMPSSHAASLLRRAADIMPEEEESSDEEYRPPRGPRSFDQRPQSAGILHARPRRSKRLQAQRAARKRPGTSTGARRPTSPKPSDHRNAKVEKELKKKPILEDDDNEGVFDMEVLQHQLHGMLRAAQKDTFDDDEERRQDTRSLMRDEKLDHIRAERADAELQNKWKAVLLQRRDDEERVYREVYRQVLKYEKQRLIEERAKTKLLEKQHRSELSMKKEALEVYYGDQVQMLKKQIADTKSNRKSIRKAHELKLDQMVREQRRRTWEDLEMRRNKFFSAEDKRFQTEVQPDNLAENILNRLYRKSHS